MTFVANEDIPLFEPLTPFHIRSLNKSPYFGPYDNIVIDVATTKFSIKLSLEFQPPIFKKSINTIASNVSIVPITPVAF